MSEQRRWRMPGYAGDKEQVLTRLRRIEGRYGAWSGWSTRTPTASMC
jgi:hypothetical protein